MRILSHIFSTKINRVFVIFVFEILTNRYLRMSLILNNWALVFRPLYTRSQRIKLSYYNLSNVCLFVCLFVCSPTPPRSLGRSSPNLEGRWRAAPDIRLRGSFFERSRSSRPKVKFMFFFLFVPLLLPGPWADLHQT